MSVCSFDPTTLAGQPIGMFHCPECGEMVVAGAAHPDYSVLNRGMTLCEAVKIGYRVRRRGKSTWHGHMGTAYLVDATAGHWMDIRTLLDEGCLELSDLIADDWEALE